MVYFDHDDFLTSLTFAIFFAGSIFVLLSVYVTSGMVKELVKKGEKLKVDLDQTKKKLIETKKVAALGAIAEATAHEINNPLTIILSSLEVVKRRVAKGELTEEYFNQTHENIKEAGSRIKNTVSEFQSYSFKNHQDNLVRVNLIILLKQVTDELQGDFKKRDINIILEYPEDVKVISREKDVNEICTIVIINAIEALNKFSGSKEILIEVIPNSKNSILRIHNSGPMIDSNIIDNIFDPFFTTKGLGESKGRGLSLAKAIMLSQGGDINYIVDEEKAHFEITFVTA
ncbi:MAG: C4-dicarboxylate-specific signal transduction histidine kinase [Bacteriovoracaceae bacterium]|jgi:C4-dicarboxylate-specific signal transduction histidine kinase